MTSKARDFFYYTGIDNTCDVIYYISETTEDCNEKKELLIDDRYDIVDGEISVSIAKSEIPQDIGNDASVIVLYDGDGVVSEVLYEDSNISFSIAGAGTISEAFNEYVNEKISIVIVSGDKTVGCRVELEYTVDPTLLKIVYDDSSNELKIVYDDDNDSIDVDILDIGPIAWFVDYTEDSTGANSVSLDVTNTRLTKITDNYSANIYAMVGDVKIEYGEWIIPQNAYELDAYLDYVINGDFIYANIFASAESAPEDMNLTVFIDGEKYDSDNFMLTDEMVGKSVCAVVHKDNLDEFDEEKYELYEISKCIAVDDETFDTVYGDDVLNRLLDAVESDNTIVNTMFPGIKQIPIDMVDINNYDIFLNKIVVETDMEEYCYTVDYIRSSTPTKVGEILYFNNKFHIVREDMSVEEIVDLSRFIEKEVVTVKDEYYYAIFTSQMFDNFFESNTNLVTDSDGWITQQSDDDEFSVEAIFDKDITNVQIELKYTKQTNPRTSKFLIYLMTLDGEHVSKYGFERQTDGTMAFYDEDRNTIMMNQDDFYTQMTIYPTATQKAEMIKIVGVGMSIDKIMFKNLVIGIEK